MFGKEGPDPLPSYQTDFGGKQTNNLLIFLSENHECNRGRFRKPKTFQILAQNFLPPDPIQAAQSLHKCQVFLGISRGLAIVWQQIMYFLWQRCWCLTISPQITVREQRTWLLIILTLKRWVNENQAVKWSPNVSTLPKRQRLKLFSITLHN